MKRLIFYILIIAVNSVFCQHTSDLNENSSTNNSIKVSSEPLDIANETNSVTLFAKLILFAYEKIIHPQTSQSHVFLPSTLDYTKKAYNLYNPIKATLLSSDRLLRRHPLAKRNYEINPDGVLLDNIPQLFEKRKLLQLRTISSQENKRANNEN